MTAPARAFCAAFLLIGCAAPDLQALQTSVQRYNDGLRWKRFTEAARFRLAEEQTAFMKRYLAAEEDLHVESIEVRSVVAVPNEPVPTYDVTVIAELYVLPSTVLEKIVIVERWRAAGAGWVLAASDRELAPERP